MAHCLCMLYCLVTTTQLTLAAAMANTSRALFICQCANSWSYKTYYYSDNPSWAQLQQLVQPHATVVSAAAGQGHEHVQPLTRRQQQQLWRQQQKQQHWQQQQQQERQQKEQFNLHEQRSLSPRQLQQPSQQLLPSQQPGQQSQQLDDTNQGHHDDCQQPQHHRQHGREQVVSDIHAGQASPTAAEPASCAVSSPLSAKPSSLSRAGLISVAVSENLFEGSTGCYAWEAGYLLAEFVINCPHIFRGKQHALGMHALRLPAFNGTECHAVSLILMLVLY